VSQPQPGRPYLLREAEGETVWFLGNLITFKATGSETRGRVVVADFVHPAGFSPPLHRHLDEDEMFYVLSGTAEYALARAAARHGNEILGPPLAALALARTSEMTVCGQRSQYRDPHHSGSVCFHAE
jgi:oxalate decarboxylase/phosphoglucose isomerase-like protein (cupin superfamily)